jgi:hypothetical protein
MIIDKIFNQLLQIKIHNHGSPIYRKIFQRNEVIKKRRKQDPSAYKSKGSILILQTSISVLNNYSHENIKR